MNDLFCEGCSMPVDLSEVKEENQPVTPEQAPPTCTDPNGLCGNCCTIFTDPTRRGRFGITRTQAFCDCRDICIQEVRAICAQNIDFTVPIPTGAGAADCRGEFPPTPPPFANCRVQVTCAEETLRADCTGVDITVGFQIAVDAVGVTPPRTFIINHFRPFTCFNFFAFPDGNPVNVPELLRIIDGSQLVIQDLRCEILDAANPRIRVRGVLVDKLWKEENLWIQAIRPYSGITVKQEFDEPHRIGRCNINPAND
jgi:hypothetical protein